MRTYTIKFSGTMTVRERGHESALRAVFLRVPHASSVEIIGQTSEPEQQPNPGRLIIWCSWCRAGQTPPPGITHGICEKHKAEQLALLRLAPATPV